MQETLVVTKVMSSGDRPKHCETCESRPPAPALFPLKPVHHFPEELANHAGTPSHRAPRPFLSQARKRRFHRRVDPYPTTAAARQGT